MANNKLILRTLTSPWVYPTTDITKNSVLTHTDVDNNFIYLKGEVVYTAQTSGTDLILNKINNSNITIDLSSMNDGSGAFTSTTANNSIIPTIPFGNSNDSDNASILGGSNNTITTGYTSSVIGGGSGNTMPSYSPTTPYQNEYLFSATHYDNNIAGGSNNQISSYASTIGGGSNNQIGKGFVYTYGAYGYYYESRFGGGSIISGGLDNIIGDYSAFANIDGGEKNRIGVLGRYSSYATFNVKWNTIGGGVENLIYATLTGTSSSINIISGGRLNKIKDSSSSVIGGGFNNWIVDSRECTNNGMASRTYNSWGSSISGRLNKIIGADKSVISGGEFNVIKSGSTYSFIGGGEKNVVKSASTYSSIVGGSGNTITSSNFSTIVGGSGNTVNHSHSHILGSNIISVSANTTHIEKLNIKTLNGTTAVTSLAIDADGMVVDGTSLGGVDGPFTSTTAFNTIIPTIPFNNVNDGAYSSILGGGNNVISGVHICQTIAGGGFNSVSQNFSTVGGGANNEIEASHSFVGSGYKNKIIPTSSAGKENSIVGGKLNLIGGVSNKSTIVGGLSNIITGSTSSTIGGGDNNEIDVSHGFIGGGSTNHIVDGVKSIIGGGQQNEIHEQHSFIGGGVNNIINSSNFGQSNNIVGGWGNIVSGTFSTVGGGKNNHIITGWANTIAGGYDNTTNSGGKNIIGGGDNNTINNYYYSSILGGELNVVNHSHSHIIGSNITTVSANTTHVEKLNIKTLNGTTAVTALALDADGMVVDGTSLDGVGAFTHVASGIITPTNAYGNTIIEASNYSTIAGGQNNTIASGSTYSFIGGGFNNVIDTYSYRSTIAGGVNNNIDNGGYRSFIGGGENNDIIGGSYGSTIAGGLTNVIGGSRNSIIGGGSNNIILTSSVASTISGGFSNTINDSTYGVISGGRLNGISGSSDYSIIVGGRGNAISGSSVFSTIGGGSGNTLNHSYAHILGSNITSVSANTTHVEKLNIGTLSIVTTGTTIIDNLGIESNGMVVKSYTTKRLEIGDWDMTASTQVTVAHGLSATEWKTILRSDALIRNDSDTVYVPLNGIEAPSTGLPNGGVAAYDSTNITLSRYTTGDFDTNDFNSTSYNRGWVTFDYIGD